MLVVLSNIPNRGFNAPIEVTPYWVTADGTKVTGKTSVKKISDMIR